MDKLSSSEIQGQAISKFIQSFLKHKFAFSSSAIKVLMEADTMMILVEDFLSRAETRAGMKKKDAEMVREMYSKLFDKENKVLSDGISGIIDRKVLSCQTSINFETGFIIIAFFLKQG